MYLIFGIGLVHVKQTQKMVTVEQRPDIIVVPRGEGHGKSMKQVKFIANRFMKEQEIKIVDFVSEPLKQAFDEEEDEEESIEKKNTKMPCTKYLSCPAPPKPFNLPCKTRDTADIVNCSQATSRVFKTRNVRV
jgi:DNA-binding protein